METGYPPFDKELRASASEEVRRSKILMDGGGMGFSDIFLGRVSMSSTTRAARRPGYRAA
eukprot:CAMPEP_0194315098 /NCGR_PEP_ID=MMETSP0171-20130528/11912_1 /TAXON_ID=218684 /ORGANISM="Corethron pennatum, Strain L29A3" /LENGTH=59 /DNA_ID=CAMNT_0039070771 /DNA_START=371 /DNA_END=550 /DNA_ORIENTATION=-